MNGDGEITAADALAVLSSVVGKKLPAGYDLRPNGDSNGDGQVSAMDALVILGYAVDRDVSKFPVGRAIVKVSLDADSLVLITGQQRLLTASVVDGEADVIWRSSAENVAVVNPAGKLTAVSPGEATITATSKADTTSRAQMTVRVVKAQVAGVTVSPTTQLFASLGATQALTAAVTSTNGQPLAGLSVEWSSSNPKIVSVDASGVVKAVSNGTATVTAAVGGKRGSARVTVQQAVAAVELSPASVILAADDTLRLHARVLDAGGSAMNAAPVAWSSSNPKVASVDASGLVKAVGTGKATVTASRGGKSGVAEVEVRSVTVGSVSVTPTTKTLAAVGAGVQLAAAAKDAKGAALVGLTASWSSSDTTVATVNANGYVTARGGGSATITASMGGKIGSASIAVAQAVASVAIRPASATLVVGDTLRLAAEVKDANANVIAGATRAWSSSKPAVATVDAAGVVKAVSVGSTNITLFSGGKSASAVVTVTTQPTVSAKAASLAISPAAVTLKALGATATLSATAKDAGGEVISDCAVSWSSLSPSIAEVGEAGSVVARAVGVARITAACGGAADTVAVTVQQDIASLVVSPSSVLVGVGATQSLTATAKDANGNAMAGASIAWLSSDPAVAVVSSTGTVTGMAAGSATIFASSAGQRDSAVVSVASDSSLATADPSTVPELPRSEVDVSMPATGGKVITVPAGGSLQAAINNAQRGDVIELQAGATFRGQFTLPAKSGSGWIVIRSSDHASLPEGQRVGPSDAPHMARLTWGWRNQPVLTTASGASGYRIIGLEITTNAADVPTLITSLVNLNSGSSDVILDRMYIHSAPTQGVQRCVTLNNARAAVIDSYLDECHADGFDSQAIEGWRGPGPYLIRNNYLAGAGENVMFGGATVGSGEIPSDIVIRGNLFHKPDAWRGSNWSVKNLLELKMAQRLLIEDNVFDGNWADAQAGFAIVIKSENRDKDTHPEYATTDVTFRRNRILNSLQGINIAGKGSTDRVSGTGRTARVRLEDVTMPLDGTYARGIQVLAGARDVVLDRVRTNGRVWLDNGGLMRYRQENSCTSRVMSSGIREGTVTLDTRAPDWTFRNNTVIDLEPLWVPWYPQGDGNTYPIGGTCPTS